MTLYVPLDLKDELPNSPPFLIPPKTPESHLNNVVQAILKAKRIAVVCGAGISVDAGIPDFRSQDGLFQSLKRDNPKESLTSGKDLFDASVFKSAQKTALFYRMIANLASLSSQGQPTAFHKLLRTLDDRGQLLRVYTQNIDALEMKAGLSFGVPEFEEKHLRVKLKGKAKIKAKEAGSDTYSSKSSGRPKKRMPSPGLPSVIKEDQPIAGPSTKPTRPHSSGPSSLPKHSSPSIIPRCIPLHGTLLTLHCQHCTQSFPLDPPPPPSARGFSPPPSPGSSKPHSLYSLLSLGTPPPCPSCASLEQTRALVGKRLRGVGKLRPSVVLYGEDHREGEGVGEVVRRDLCGIGDVKLATSSSDKGESSSPTKIRARPRKGPDLLLVVGTSLRVPGTKRIVREFSKAVRSRTSPSSSHLPTPSPPPQSENAVENIRTIYLNNEFPLPSREWEGVFDTWVNGDVQAVARMVVEIIQEGGQKQTDKKQKMAARESGASQGDNQRGKSKRKCEDNISWTPVTPNKRQKVDVILPRTISKPFRTHQENTRASSSPPITNSKMRRVVLRLPSRPSTPPPSPSAYKCKRPIPEVILSKSSFMSCSTMEECQWKASVEYPLKVSV